MNKRVMCLAKDFNTDTIHNLETTLRKIMPQRYQCSDL